MTRIFAGLVFATFLTTGAASASSFVTPEPMTAKLGPSMIALGEPASEPVAAASQPAPDEKIAKAIDRTPLEYPLPGGKVPVFRASGKIVVRTPLNYPAPASDPKPAEAAPWFLKNYQADKQGARAADSLLYLAEAMIVQKDTKRACIALAEFSETYPVVATGRLKSQYEADRRKVKCD